MYYVDIMEYYSEAKYKELLIHMSCWIYTHNMLLKYILYVYGKKDQVNQTNLY